MYPQPYVVSPPAVPRSSAEFRRRALYRGGNVDPIPFIRTMWEAATWGGAMLVPLIETKSGTAPTQTAFAEVLSKPGRRRSRVGRPSALGPRPPHPATVSSV